jgi:ribosomal protein S18 acetylase RimI-like enzyme/2-polyprenyl-3-methyl-5-hydroxy-6-metoxy-1,4-benzoquinol methylase
MSELVEFCLNQATEAEIADHLLRCDADFVPPLSGRVEIDGYAHKIADKAMRFEAWAEGVLVGLVAAYCNDSERCAAYITSVSVLQGWKIRGIASRLMKQCIEHVKEQGFECIELEVDSQNISAAKLYEKMGFIMNRMNDRTAIMHLNTGKEVKMSNQRDYNGEINDTADHQYAYSFDFDVMHPFMIRSFEPFFNKGSLLELGSFKGDFTKRFLFYFDDVTCVEASDVAIEEAKSKLSDKVRFVNSRFETATLPKRYDNIVLTHVLEHLDDPVRVLTRINDEWLAEGGRFFLVCPNANAPSRQIAVKMGLITHNAAVTPAEAEHGHRCTYSLDTLERDAVAAGLKVVHRSGIFFKALANFQWDRLLNTDIISKEYLEGCYKLGQYYPDLCSSIFLMCERGDQ